jgi:hypothetical protein
MAGVMVDESQPRPHLPPEDMALLIAAVSSVEPSLKFVSIVQVEEDDKPTPWLQSS